MTNIDQSKEHRGKEQTKEHRMPSRHQLARNQLSKDHLSREPLREIRDERDSSRTIKKENSNEMDPRKNRIDFTDWVKTKYNTDELSLPNVHGGELRVIIF